MVLLFFGCILKGLQLVQEPSVRSPLGSEFIGDQEIPKAHFSDDKKKGTRKYLR